MEHRIFQKQGYLDTGNQKITEPLRSGFRIPPGWASAGLPITLRANFMIGSGHSEGVCLCGCYAERTPTMESVFTW